MKRTPPQPLAAAAVSRFKQGAVALALVSGVINILGLTAPLFMLQVYDRVLASRSIPTLLGFSVLAMIAYGFQLLLEIIRSRVLLRAGEFFDHELSRRVHEAVVRLALQTRAPGDGLQALRDLDNIRSFLSGQGPAAFFDLPWAPLYLAICFGLHVWIGLTALAGAAILTALTILTHKLSSAPVRETIKYGMERNAILDGSRRNAEVIRALGLGERSADRWIAVNRKYLAANRRAGDVGNALGGTARVSDHVAIGGPWRRWVSRHSTKCHGRRHGRQFRHLGARPRACRSRGRHVAVPFDRSAKLGAPAGSLVVRRTSSKHDPAAEAEGESHR